jgi:hypothetical protein
MTTSTDSAFERVYLVEVVDEVNEISHTIAQSYIGELNTERQRSRMRTSHRRSYRSLRDETPPLLDDFDVTVTEDTANSNQVDIEIGVDVVDVIDTIDIDVIVGEVIRNGGASV